MKSNNFSLTKKKGIQLKLIENLFSVNPEDVIINLLRKFSCHIFKKQYKQ